MFASLESDEKIEEIKKRDAQRCPLITIVMNVVGFIAVITVAIVIQVLFIAEDDEK